MDTIQSIRAEAARIIEDCTYSSKGHFEAARRWGYINFSLGMPAALLAALSGASALGQHPDLAAGIAFLVAAITAITTFLNAEKRASAHKSAGAQYLALRNRTRIYREIDLMQPTSTPTELVSQLKTLAQQREDLNAAGPDIPRWAFVAARRGIEQGEARHAIDSEPSTPQS